MGIPRNRFITRLYGNALEGPNGRRWRIEHAQVIHPDDFQRFHDNSIIPSVQPVHCASDMKWAKARIGRERLKGGYAYKSLLEHAGILAYGSDFPVESPNLMLGLHAAVTRTDLEGWPYNRFFPEQALTREEFIRSATIWAAYSCFEEEEKGS